MGGVRRGDCGGPQSSNRDVMVDNIDVVYEGKAGRNLVIIQRK